jgi:hypothetical protein
MKTVRAQWYGSLPGERGEVELEVPDNAQLDIIIFQVMEHFEVDGHEPHLSEIRWTITNSR